MDLSPDPNLCKAEKLKSQSAQRILQKKFLFSLFDTSGMQQIVERCKSILFLIPSISPYYCI